MIALDSLSKFGFAFLSISLIAFNYAIWLKTATLSYPEAVINTVRQIGARIFRCR